MNKDTIRVRCMYYNNGLCCTKPNMTEKIGNCIYKFGRLKERDEDCNNFTLDWVKFLLYKEHLIEIKKDE